MFNEEFLTVANTLLMPDDFTHQGESAATQWVNIAVLYSNQ
jgi:hypothetical protein